MARTVDSQEQSSRKQIHHGLFVLGVFMLVAGVVLSVSALQYEFKQSSSGNDDGQAPVYEYWMLTAQEQHVVDGALNGKTYVFDTRKPLPGESTLGLQPTTMTVNMWEGYRTFTYRIVFPARAPKGLASIALIVGGLLAMVEAVRRYRFSKSLPW